jgi:hypothetical protein
LCWILYSSICDRRLVRVVLQLLNQNFYQCKTFVLSHVTTLSFLVLACF